MESQKKNYIIFLAINAILPVKKVNIMSQIEGV